MIRRGYALGTWMCALPLLVALALSPQAAAAGRAFDEAQRARLAGDFVSAAALYKLAANAGDPTAAHWAGTFYLEGIGVRRDTSLAVRYLEMAAAGGVVLSMITLADLYLSGDVVPADCAKARDWIGRATDGALPDAWVTALRACEGRAG